MAFGETYHLWRAVDQEGEVLEAYVTKSRNRHAALRFLRKALKRYGQPQRIVTDGLGSYRAALKAIDLERIRQLAVDGPLGQAANQITHFVSFHIVSNPTFRQIHCLVRKQKLGPRKAGIDTSVDWFKTSCWCVPLHEE